MNNRGQFSIIAAMFVAVILISSVMMTYSAIRYSSTQEEPQILSAIDETNLALKQVLGFTVGYYGSVLQVTGNSTYARALASKYLDSGLANIADVKPEWGASFTITDLVLSNYWFMNASYSKGTLTVNYSLTGLGVSGVTYSASCRLDVNIFQSSSSSQVCLNVTKDGEEPLNDLGKQNFKFYRYRYSNLTWEMVSPSNEPIAFSNGTYLVDVPPDVNPYAYTIQVEDTRGLIVAASSFSQYTSSLLFNSTFVNDLDFVDSSTSNVDSSSGAGTHSNFEEQKRGPDSIHDTLTEGNVGNASQDYYPNNYIPLGSTTLVSGSLTDLQSDNAAYMKFRAYPSAFSGSASFGYSIKGNYSQDIENVIRGSLFTASSGGIAQNISTYIELTGASQTFGQPSTQYSTTASIENTIKGSRFSPSYNGVATSITVYIDLSSTSSRTVKAAIYSDAHGLIDSTEEKVVTSDGWVTFNFLDPKPTLVAGTNYVLVAWSNEAGGSVYMHYQSGYSGEGHSISQTYGGWPSSPSFSHESREYCIYCTYQPSAKVKAAIYSSSHNFVAGTEEKTVSSDGWVTFNFADPQPALTEGTNYVLSVWAADTAGDVLIFYDGGSSNQGHSQSITYGSWPSSASFSHSNYKYSVSCSYAIASEYSCEVEFAGLSNLNDWNSLNWTIDGSSTSSVDVTLQLYDYSTGQYPTSGNGYLTSTFVTSDTTKRQNITSSSAEFRDAIGGWKVKFRAVKSTSFNISIDFAKFNPASANYALDLEEQWIELNQAVHNPELCIKTGALGLENLAVDVWNNQSGPGHWDSFLGSLVENGWNNKSIATYLSSSTLTIRFSSNDAGDTVQNNWLIDAVFLRAESDQSLFTSLNDAVVTVEVLQNGTMRWLGQNLRLTSQEIPIPPVPVKSIHLKQTIDGVNQEVPFQVEDWASEYSVPLGLTSNTTVFSNRQMIVSLISTHVSQFTIWWNGSDDAVQTPLAFTNRYFNNDNPNGGILNNGRLNLQFGSGFTVTSTVVGGTGASSVASFMRLNNKTSSYGAGLAYVIHHGVIRDVVQQEAEWSGGATNCPNVYSSIVLTLPANATYFTYQLRLTFIASQQDRTITDLCPLSLSYNVGQFQTENGTVLHDPIVAPGGGIFNNFLSNPWTAHHWSQFIQGTRGAGLMFTDAANQRLYAFDSMARSATGALKADNSTGRIELLPVAIFQVQFQSTLDVTWHGAVVTFDGGNPIYSNNGHGLWILAELPPTMTVNTGN